MIDLDLENELRPHLSVGENLIWAGKPKTGIVFRSPDLYLIPFSLLWGGIAIVWEVIAISTGPLLFNLVGIPFVCLGLYLIVGRFFFDAKKRAGTTYGITKDRIIIKSGVFSKDIQSFNIKMLSEITLIQKADNSGSIVLGPMHPIYNMLQGANWPGVNQAPMIELVADIKTVYDQIVALQRA